MVGQQNLLNQIDWMCQSKCFPRFSIITGEKGSQKKEMAQYIAKKLECFLFEAVDNKIDTIRGVIEQAYKTHSPIVYVIDNADDMSVPAKNALLKVTEEPPNNAYFVMILDDVNNTLDTIKSRAVILTMEPYSKRQLKDYAQETYQDNHEIYTDLCSTPGQIDLLYKMDAEKFYGYVAKVVDNIAEVSGANSFKIAEKVALKDEEDKYDLEMFWKACCKLFYDKRGHYVKSVYARQATSKALQKLSSIKGVNKQMLFDEWLISVRAVLR